ncbi:MAG: protoheme IX farnesyltransferase [Bryobacteraceae bacterium]|nr:protoheme IX farnesyltransferase [Bryobacteraceae bacterium]
MKDYIELTKPRITWLILMSTGVGFFFGAQGNAWSWLVLLHTVVGTGLIASGTAALNQWMERDADSYMNRTRQRPLPSGRLTPGRACAFAVGLSLLGFAELWLGANPLTAALGFFTLASYLFVYTPLKRITPHSTTVGAIPGAMPPVIGFAAARGELTVEALALFAILFLWQFPHFYSIAWLYREDYGRAGIRMLPVVDPTGERTARQILLTGLLLIPVSLLPSFLGMTGLPYLIGAFLLGCMYFWYGVRVSHERSLLRARGVLIASIVYLPLLYVLLLADRTRL